MCARPRLVGLTAVGAWTARTLEQAPIDFYDVPACAREEARHLVEAGSSPDAREGTALTQAELLHLRDMLQQMTAVEEHLERAHRVHEPAKASVFLVPALFPILFWLDQRVTPPEHARHLQCVNETTTALERLPYLKRRMGYDHLILYGYEYPHWKKHAHLLLESYSPLLGNALLLAVSFWSQGRRAALLEAGLYQLARVIAIPYFARWDCGRAELLLSTTRDVSVSFVGSLKNRAPYFVFRERLLVAAASRRPAIANDSRALLEFFPADDESRHAFARDHKGDRERLYARSDFCLVMPGDGNTAGRLFHVMMQGCIPVLAFHPDTYPVLPFSNFIAWEEIALVETVGTEDEAAAMLARLLATPAWERELYRRRVVEHAPRVALALANCGQEAESALSLVSLELQRRALQLHEELLPRAFGLMAPPSDPSHWLRWGPAFHSV